MNETEHPQHSEPIGGENTIDNPHSWIAWKKEAERLQERLRLDREALEAARERIQAHNRGSTHYAGCECEHKDCAALRLIEARLEVKE